MSISNTIVVDGKVWKFGDDINTDFMAPSFSKGMEWEQAKKTILHIHEGFTEGVAEGDVIVAGANFGCGSSRQQAPANLKMLGIGCVVAESFGRIFFRNAVAIALPVMACPGISEAFNEGDDLQLDFEKSLVKNVTQGTEMQGALMPEDLLKIVRAGGVMAVLKEEAAA
ncbi:MAG: 3-isopropylmalate dehydratase [Rhodospirillaceae bacterium]|jgi:3-isopropylmalate/(R)-2-methylmalate dehydratase small subunit|nr:3-isopropylmalate dehydratase [Rhodospirillaceae bacterium]MBT3884050.1 3-isopropylmalate dehydratase [Rhodospirillaceae bacterium]MBT4117307.1 3-isopropylmalate dehydratase [Rhodospirillaceae bacterium]MBT4670699.1 3-isopropylmalate dehydratase [Rhodospirillaceae bacterium]MBT4720355.1 3-isopropylmalate dehydratase [Rhodospirillaceae bacterium]